MTAEEFLGIKEYLKQALKIQWRHTLNGDLYIVLVLEDEVISKIPFEQDD